MSCSAVILAGNWFNWLCSRPTTQGQSCWAAPLTLVQLLLCDLMCKGNLQQMRVLARVAGAAVQTAPVDARTLTVCSAPFMPIIVSCRAYI